MWTSGLIAVLGFTAAAVLAVVGSFQQFYRFEVRADGATSTLEQNLWEVANDERVVGAPVPAGTGWLVVAAAGFLAIAALVGLVAALRPARALLTTVRVAGALGAGALAGIAGFTLLLLSDVVDQVLRARPEQSEQVEITVGTGPGLVLLLVGAGVGVLAVVPALIRKEPKAAPAEPLTPSMGFPVQRAPQFQHPGAAQHRPQAGAPNTGATVAIPRAQAGPTQVVAQQPGAPAPHQGYAPAGFQQQGPAWGPPPAKAEAAGDDGETTQVVGGAAAAGQHPEIDRADMPATTLDENPDDKTTEVSALKPDAPADDAEKPSEERAAVDAGEDVAVAAPEAAPSEKDTAEKATAEQDTAEKDATDKDHIEKAAVDTSSSKE
ncbi:hypothetical protein [Actinokineospora bangkokensis]|uniref:Uncharacterized protein n=1 Tax=Actinokineospora bangkokensis TaxID=1193682 RepID=A0A1Q9LQH4_9PSEU|nr:hypothetical protein [Actinokineospora bangkokensis]OLR94270.1 hypothetical protein BJP25_10845 [Actinokineospora bangkokensis]